MAVILHSWRRRDPRTGRWRVLRWKMTDDQAREWAAKEGAEIEKVPGSEEVRTDVSGRGTVFFHAYCTEAIEECQHNRVGPAHHFDMEN